MNGEQYVYIASISDDYLRVVTIGHSLTIEGVKRLVEDYHKTLFANVPIEWKSLTIPNGREYGAFAKFDYENLGYKYEIQSIELDVVETYDEPT